MIIDCHGHYTTAPKQLEEWRKRQIAGLEDATHAPVKGSLGISDDEIRASLEGAQLKLQRERGTDITLFSPRAMGMSHHIGNETTSRHWSEHCNEMIHRVCTLYPEKMVELEVPAMVHVSASCNPNFHGTGAHYINGDTTAFMQFITADLFRDFQ